MSRVPAYSRHRRTAPPCKGCEDRVVGCHSRCDKYKEWKAQDLEKIKQANDLHLAEQVVDDYVVKKIRSVKARKGRAKI